MKRLSIPIVLALCIPLLTAPAGLAAVQPERIPLHIESRYAPTAPAWISARALVNSKGELNLDALPMGFGKTIQQQVASGEYQKRGCIQTLEVSIDPPPGPAKGHGTLGDLTRNAIAILRGTVTAVDPGFGSYGTPALLLKVEVTDRIKTSDAIAGSTYIYLEYPVASFEAGGYRFCKKDSRWPEPPEVGDQLMVFPYGHPKDAAGQLIAPRPDGFEVLLERKRDGVLVIPQALKNAPDLIGVKRLEGVRERTKEHVRELTGDPHESGL